MDALNLRGNLERFRSSAERKGENVATATSVEFKQSDCCNPQKRFFSKEQQDRVEDAGPAVTPKDFVPAVSAGKKSLEATL
jgi:hypothetical protein